jgi:OOP family OmpA-OmpF porin
VRLDNDPAPGIRDSDGDGILDAQDQCPQEAGVEPGGCPVTDTDGDGILDATDACVDAPETANGFEDADGCPDELPAEVQQFNGVIQGIFFDTGKATIKSTSEAVLDNSAKVLAQYPDLRVEIAGHTDDRGGHDANVELSQRRAESVKQYLVDKGIDAARIQTRGAGPDEPMADNASKAGRAKNRRIEFKLVP